jgi:hypothetical protein
VSTLEAGGDGGPTPLAGASITVLAAAGPQAGQPISATVISQPASSPCDGGYCSPVGFVLPIPLDQVVFDGGGCVPSTQPAPCGLDGGCSFSPCASFILEVGPSAATDASGTLPTVDFLVRRQITPVDPGSNFGLEAGPTVSLMGDDQLGIRLPIGPGIGSVTGGAKDDLFNPLGGALVELRSMADGGLTGCAGQPPMVAIDSTGAALCSYRARTITLGLNGFFSLQAPPGGYTLTVTPPPSQPSLAPSAPKPIFVPAGGGSPPETNVVVRVATVVRGHIIDPRSGLSLGAGQVQVFPVNSAQLIGMTPIDGNGNFALPLPPTNTSPYLVSFLPPAGLGLALSSQIISVPSQAPPVDVHTQPVSIGVPLSGSVFAQTLDGSRRPVGGAAVSFYLLLTTMQGQVAVPVASSVTDSLGRYAVLVPNVPPQ